MSTFQQQPRHSVSPSMLLVTELYLRAYWPYYLIAALWALGVFFIFR